MAGTSVISAVDTRGAGRVGDVATGPVDRPHQLADLDRAVVVDDLVAPLGGVVGGDVVVGGLERVAEVGRDGVERGPHLGLGHPEVVEHDPVEALGEPAQGGVAVASHLVEDRPHLVDGRLGLGGGSRQDVTEVATCVAAARRVVGPAGAGTGSDTGRPQVESLEHDGQRYRSG